MLVQLSRLVPQAAQLPEGPRPKGVQGLQPKLPISWAPTGCAKPLLETLIGHSLQQLPGTQKTSSLRSQLHRSGLPAG